VVRPGVVTPEAVVLEFETAGIASRLLGGLIDAGIQGALLLGLSFGFIVVAQSGVPFGGVASGMLYVALFLVVFGYPAALETLWRGRTVGKAALGLRVVTVEGAPIRFRHAAIRSILQLVDKVLFTGLFGVLAMLFTARNQRLGDLVAGTLVLRERTGARAPHAVTFSVPSGLEPYAATLDVAGIGHQDYGAVRSFLLRAPSLPPGVRHELARGLAVPLVTRLRTTPPPGVGPELFLACLAAAYQRGDGARPAPGATITSVWSEPGPASATPRASPSGGTAVAGGFVAPD
jgi:uncharacterized RDD family membrane protein YckC